MGIIIIFIIHTLKDHDTLGGGLGGGGGHVEMMGMENTVNQRERKAELFCPHLRIKSGRKDGRSR